MSVMAVVVKSADIPREDAVKIGFSVFTASIPVSMIFLTGDASINPLAAASCAPEPMGWITWFKGNGCTNGFDKYCHYDYDNVSFQAF